MKRVSREFVLDLCSKRMAAGHNVDARLRKELESGELYSLQLSDEESFLSLIWQDIGETRLLTPKNQPRTLREVAQRAVDGAHTFKSLSQSPGLSASQHNPAWF